VNLSILMRLAGAALCAVTAAGCGSELLRTGRSPVFLAITQIDAAKGNDTGTFATPLLSDVETLVEVTVNGTTTKVPTIFNDLGRAAFEVVAKDQTLTASPTTPINAVTLQRYRVTYRRTDGRSTPGVDVPFPIEGGLTATIAPGQSGEVIFDLVRHAAKSEPPLRNLRHLGGSIFISTVAEVTFYGRDQNGNEVVATGTVDVTFADFGDED
jgi:hypothetical protein